jgi:predicted Zn-dependent protease
MLSPVRAEQKCPVLAIHDSPKVHNIFNAQQELELGDVEAEVLEERYQIIPDAAFAEHVTAIQKRLFSCFTPGQANIRIILIDTPEVNAFSVGSSRIYLTRKIVAMVRSDDELAGLLAHEFAHMVTHQNATVVSETFDQILGVEAVGDRTDIAEKFNRMLNSTAWNTSAFQNGAQRMQQEEENGQYEADRFALHIMAAAGFSPRAYAEFFDRTAETHGKRGNPVTDLLGRTTANQKRLREIYKSLHALPNASRDLAAPASSPEFLAWQAEVTTGPSSTVLKRGSK